MSAAHPPSREDEIRKKGYMTSFQAHTVFLTGGTGSLGGCLLYKLALQLPTRKIFVLVRGSPEVAEKKWRRWMPEQTQAILDTKKVHFIVGDITKQDFGMQTADLEKLQQEVTLVIHTAATIVLNATVPESIQNNCLPSLELARIASQFKRLRLFVQISTAYVNSFLPDGFVGEKLYPISDQDPDEELNAVLSSGISPYADRFGSTYGYAKHLMERLMLKRYPLLPLLLVRPTIFGPALRYPYPKYGPPNSTPMTKFAQLYLADRGGTQIWHATEGYKSGANILDEIPVDFVANGCLLHAAAKTQGIVHIGSQLYVSFTFDDIIHFSESIVPPEIRKELPEVIFTEDRSVPQTFLADLVKVGTRNWHFDCGRSYWLKQVGGPLSFVACKHEADALNAARVEEIWRKNTAKTAKL